jgi:hypothetical protein
MASQTRYEYKPLTADDGIRLIDLLPSEDHSSPIHCRFLYTTISACDDEAIYINYTALSYVWGSPERTRSITIDGSIVDVTENLHTALRDIRHESRRVHLWADGICINQTDDIEKASQIRIMGQIYATAQHTIAYLGPVNIEEGGDLVGLTRLKTHLVSLPNSSTGLRRDLDNLMSRDWFKRVWVFQELVFSTDPWIQCGRAKVRWNRFYTVMKHEMDVEARNGMLLPPKSPGDAVVQMHEAWEHHHGKSGPVNAINPFLTHYAQEEKYTQNDMINLLLTRRGLGVSDPRDMIFAHLGFATDGRHEDLQIDYSQTTCQVFQDFAWYLSKTSGLQVLLACVGETRARNHPGSLPSWVPDWTTSISTVWSPSWSAKDQIDCPWNSRSYLHLKDEAVLACELYVEDIVLHTSRQLSLDNIPANVRKDLASHLIPAEGLLKAYQHKYIPHDSTTSHQIQYLWPRVYQAWRNAVHDNNILPLPQENSKVASVMLSKLQKGGTKALPLWLLYTLSDGADTSFVEGKILARMASGELALLPSSAEKGDLIASISPVLDTSHSFVFRPQAPDAFANIDKRLREHSWAHLPNRHVEFLGQGFPDIRLGPLQVPHSSSEYPRPKSKTILAIH